MKIVSWENCAAAGGLGEAIRADLVLGWPDVFIPHGSVATLEKEYGQDLESAIAKTKERLWRTCTE